VGVSRRHRSRQEGHGLAEGDDLEKLTEVGYGWSVWRLIGSGSCRMRVARLPETRRLHVGVGPGRARLSVQVIQAQPGPARQPVRRTERDEPWLLRQQRPVETFHRWWIAQ